MKTVFETVGALAGIFGVLGLFIVFTSWRGGDPARWKITAFVAVIWLAWWFLGPPPNTSGPYQHCETDWDARGNPDVCW